MPGRGRDAIEAVVAFALVAAAAASDVPALFYGVLVWIPAISVFARRDDAASIGCSTAYPLRQVAWGLGAAAAVLPIYAIGLWVFRARVVGDVTFALPAVDRVLGEGFLWAILLVGPCEEVFFRGFLQARLGAALGGRLRVLGAECGWGLLAANVLFALAHLGQGLDAERLLPFFPGLVFGWLRARTKGVIAPALFHGLCNVAQAWLYAGFG